MSLPRSLTLNFPSPCLILKVSTALQSVFLATNPNDDPPTPTFCYDRSVLRYPERDDSSTPIFCYDCFVLHAHRDGGFQDGNERCGM